MALIMLMKSRGCMGTCLTVIRRNLSSSSAPLALPKFSSKLTLFLCQRFHDVEQMVSWSSWLKRWALRRKNVYYGYTQSQYGDNIAAAFYILSMKGGFRFSGQSDWFRTNYRGKFSWDFVNFPDVPVEEVDMSRTLINYSGLNNLASQRGLRSLSLRGCPEVDDWFLSRLHIYQDTLEKLDLSHCPQITIGGLASLHHLRKLRRLELSSLPQLQSPGLVRILLEEVLPHCEISGVDYRQGLTETNTHIDKQTDSEIIQLTEEHTHTRAPHRQTLTQ